MRTRVLAFSDTRRSLIPALSHIPVKISHFILLDPSQSMHMD